MPVTEISSITPLSEYWTARKIFSEAAVLTNTIDNKSIQLSNVRTHINASMSYLVNLLNMTTEQYYGVWMKAEMEDTLHVSGLHFVDLRTVVVVDSTDVIPAQYVEEIMRVSLANSGAAKDWVGNARLQDVSELTQLSSKQNEQWYQSIAWNQYGNDLLLYIGDDIKTGLQGTVDSPYDITNQQMVIWTRRKPRLDNLLPITDPSNNFDANLDLPDKFADLLIKMTMQKMLMQIREQIPQSLEQEITQGVAQIQNLVDRELQQELAARERRLTGNQLKPIGVQ